MLPSSSVRCLSSPFAADASCSHSCPFSSNRVHLPVVSPVLLQQLSVSEPESLNCRLRSSLSCGAQLAAPTSHLICSKETHENGRPVFVFFEDLSKRKAGIIASSAALREAVQLSADEVNAIGSSESGSIKKGRNKLKRSDADSLKKKEGLNSPNSQVQANESGNDPSEKKLNRLPINLDLSLYRAKCLFRKRQYAKAEAILRQCIKDWPTDGRPYVTLGTRLVKLGRFVEARAVYEEGCQATRGENPYVWQAWAILEQKQGHVAQARRLFDASTAADIKHASAWHGWAVLELQQGSIRKARDLLTKGLKFCGPNEYLYQTLALIECRAGKDEDARVLFSQAVSCNPKSCASWLAWALMEAEKGNVSTARYLFQRSIRASPKNRFTWQAWALFEASKGKKEWARRLFERGIELNPDDAVLLQAFALFEYDSSNPDRARELFKLASIKDPEHQPVWNMPRKPGAEWDFVTKLKTLPKGNFSVRCKYCSHTWDGGANRVRAHLLGLKGYGVGSCESAPENVKDICRKLHGKTLDSASGSANINTQSHAESYADVSVSQCDDGGLGESSVGHAMKKAKSSKGALDKAWDVQARKEANKAVRRYFFAEDIPFWKVRSPYFLDMLQAVGRVGQSYKPPSYQQLRSKELHEEVRTIEGDIIQIRDAWKIFGCSIMCDGWSDTRNRPIINVMVSCIYGTVFLKSVDTSCEVKSGEFIFEILKDAIKDVGEDNVVQIVMDNASNCIRAGHLVEEQWPHIFYTRCTCHCLDLLFEDIGKLAWVKPVLENATKIVTFVTTKPTVLALFRKFSQKDLVKPAPTRFAYAFIMLTNLLDERVYNGLRSLMVCPEYTRKRVAKSQKAEELSAIVLSPFFWRNVREIIAVWHMQPYPKNFTFGR